MTRIRFQHPRKQEAYALARRHGSDPRSSYYEADGTPRRKGMASAYWAGRLGEMPKYADPARVDYPYWRAGADDRVEIDKLERGPTWKESQQ
jgi:hypothetical protein